MSWLNPWGHNRPNVEPLPNGQPVTLSTDEVLAHTLAATISNLRADLATAAERVADLQRQVDAHTAELVQAGERSRAQIHRLAAELSEAAAARVRGAAERNVLATALRNLVNALKPVTFEVDDDVLAAHAVQAEKEASELVDVIDQQKST